MREYLQVINFIVITMLLFQKSEEKKFSTSHKGTKNLDLFQFLTETNKPVPTLITINVTLVLVHNQF